MPGNEGGDLQHLFRPRLSLAVYLCTTHIIGQCIEAANVPLWTSKLGMHQVALEGFLAVINVELHPKVEVLLYALLSSIFGTFWVPGFGKYPLPVTFR